MIFLKSKNALEMSFTLERTGNYFSNGKAVKIIFTIKMH